MTGVSSCGVSSEPATPQREAPPSPSARSIADISHEARLLEEQLRCKKVVHLVDDIWFWDRAVGFVCESNDGTVVRAFVYQTPGSAMKSASEQAQGNGMAVAADDRLLISGDEDTLNTLSRNLPNLPKAQTRSLRGTAPTPAEEDAAFCVRAVSAHAMLTIEGDSESASDIADLDSVYPGYAERVAAVDREIADLALQALYQMTP
ncbi:hypothetical protein ACHMWU_17880 [Aeromicrobium sp. UC242_57]